MFLRPAPAALVGTGLAAALALAGCSSSGDAGGTPVGGSSAESRVANVTITAAHGCTPDRTTFISGALTVRIRNADATAVSEVELLSGQRIVGEKENVPPGFSGQFSVRVGAGTYALYCPGARPERSTLTVTGASAAPTDESLAALLRQATKAYGGYVSTQVGALLTAAQRLARTLHGTDLAAAQKAYVAARPFYEKIEPVAESFVVGMDSVDADLDARDGDVPAAKWRGFHRIEKALFLQRTLAGLSGYGDRLVADVRRLQRLTSGLSYQPTELANGAQELLDEVAASKITGEEERYSRIDVLDIANNVEGAEQAFAQLEPALEQIDRSLAGTIRDRFAALDKLVDTYRTDGNASGFVLYPALTKADKTQLAAAVKAVQEALSKVASKVANA
jgi:iron uptake system component EfeO